MVICRYFIKTLGKIIIKLLSSLIKIYQILISPFLGSNCRYYPTCSQYTLDALKLHGFIIGMYFSIKRILKCNPFFKGGYDPVPDNIKVKK